jgi:putative transposase
VAGYHRENASSSLNGKFRADCLHIHWFMNLDEARRKCEAWRRDYNEVRPHGAIGNEVPIMLHRAAGNPADPLPITETQDEKHRNALKRE